MVQAKPSLAIWRARRCACCSGERLWKWSGPRSRQKVPSRSMCQMAASMEAATAQPLELRPEIAVLLAAGGPGALHQGGLQPGRALAQPVGPPLAGALVVARAEAGPGEQVAGGGEAAHVGADLGDDGPGGGVADAGDGAQQADRVTERVEPALHLRVDLGQRRR